MTLNKIYSAINHSVTTVIHQIKVTRARLHSISLNLIERIRNCWRSYEGKAEFKQIKKEIANNKELNQQYLVDLTKYSKISDIGIKNIRDRLLKIYKLPENVNPIYVENKIRIVNPTYRKNVRLEAKRRFEMLKKKLKEVPASDPKRLYFLKEIDRSKDENVNQEILNIFNKGRYFLAIECNNKQESLIAIGFIHNKGLCKLLN
jgi:hypothetical protein